MRTVSNAEMVEHDHLAYRAVAIARRRTPSSLTHDDLLAAARVGLWQSLQRADPSMPGFPVYAFRRIYGAVIDEVREQDALSRRQRRSGEYSFMPLVSHDGDLRVGHADGPMAPAAESHDPDERIARRRLAAKLDAALDAIPEREAKIIVNECVLERPQIDTAQELGVSAPRVNQLRDQGLRRMARLLEDLDDDS